MNPAMVARSPYDVRKGELAGQSRAVGNETGHSILSSSAARQLVEGDADGQALEGY
jgi:hypothetical protein